MKATITTIALAALLCAAVGAYAALGGGNSGAASPSTGPKGQSPVRVSGHVARLYPGATMRLPTTVRNTTAEALRLIWVKTLDWGASDVCRGRYIRAKRVRPRVLIKPGHPERIRIPVRLKAEAPDACEGARFPLEFRTRVKSRARAVR